MSQQVECEVCKKRGHKFWHNPAPVGWFAADVSVQDLDTHEADPSQTLVVFACSPECAQKFWGEQVKTTRGP